MLGEMKFILGLIGLVLGFLIGSYLATKTKEELKAGQTWFKILIAASLIGAVLSLIFHNDVLLFSFLFFAIVTSRSLTK
ncbi:MAG: hypothetical protein ABIH59_02115 [archaeon]